jgi:hypothetical protein
MESSLSKIEEEVPVSAGGELDAEFAAMIKGES